METVSKVQRSELWNKIFSEVIKLKDFHKDNGGAEGAGDFYSVPTALEELFLEELEKRKIGNSIKGSYYMEVKIVTGGVLQLNDNQKLINEFKEHGFKFKGEPVTQDNGQVCWTFMEKNNNLVSEQQN